MDPWPLVWLLAVVVAVQGAALTLLAMVALPLWWKLFRTEARVLDQGQQLAALRADVDKLDEAAASLLEWRQGFELRNGRPVNQ